jgi:hypothetical protein
MNSEQIMRSPRAMNFLMRGKSAVSVMLAVGVIAIGSSNALAHSRPHREGMRGQDTNQSTSITDAAITRFKAALRLTPDQERNWAPVEAAMHDLVQNRVQRMAKTRDQEAEAAKSAGVKLTSPRDGVVASDHSWTAMDELRAQADERAANGDDTRKFLDASTTLYGSLDSAQQRKFGVLARDFVHREMDSRSRI